MPPSINILPSISAGGNAPGTDILIRLRGEARVTAPAVTRCLFRLLCSVAIRRAAFLRPISVEPACASDYVFIGPLISLAFLSHATYVMGLSINQNLFGKRLGFFHVFFVGVTGHLRDHIRPLPIR
jgi:hypothetical protein